MEGLQIHHAVIHALVKEQHKRIESPQIRKDVLDITHPAVIATIQGVIKVYGTKSNSAHYGTFKLNEGRGAFPDAFESYVELDAGQRDSKMFLSLSEIAMERLYDKASSQTASSGGYILFADYSLETHGRYYLIAMIKQKPGITLSEELEPQELMHLDLARLNQAARMSFARLESYLEAEESERPEMGNYLSFVSPGSTRTASGYFVTALGCSEGTAAAQATKMLVLEARRFFRETEGLAENRTAFNASLLEYLDRKEENSESVKLSEIELLARRFIPERLAGVADEIAESLLARLNSEECSVPVEFPVSRGALTGLTQIRGATESWSMSFDRSALGDEEGADIYYDRDNEKLVLTNIPGTLKESILNELASRNGG